MRKQEFIDALYKAGWDSPHDAQWTGAEKLWAEIFPAVAKIEAEIPDLIESAHMAGQYNEGEGVDPSASSARNFREKTYG